jgi:hypothetical protein
VEEARASERRGKGRPPEKERVRVVFGSLEDIVLFYIRGGSAGGAMDG